jgi:hypothetical protein
MKLTATLTLLIGLFCFCCTNVPKKDLNALKEDQKIEEKPSIPQDTIIEISDSVKLKIGLEKALDLVSKHRHQPRFKMNFDTTFQDHSFLGTNINYGYSFSKKFKHLILLNSVGYTGLYETDLRFYRETADGEMQLLLSDNGDGAFMGDTLMDVNLDGRKDFLTHWTSFSGCCPRDKYFVYLQKENGEITSRFEFMNPVFDEKKGQVRGFSYGRPEYLRLYKKRWKGYQLEPVEYIYRDENNPKILLREDGINSKITQLKTLPKEYLEFDWFNYQ